jgi:hypothetical protein
MQRVSKPIGPVRAGPESGVRTDGSPSPAPEHYRYIYVM